VKSPEFHDGIPEIGEYHKLLTTSFFKEIEDFSNEFLRINKIHLANYSEKWVVDPLHQWSRQWEYPYVLSKLSAYAFLNSSQKLTILDAGSGLTFFPFFLESRLKGSEIHCCDHDASLAHAVASINRKQNAQVQFQMASLDRTEFHEEFFDCIYCISVLEHTDDYQNILDEFYRIMKPGGILLLTFDISIDGRGEISPSSVNKLVWEVENRFAFASNNIGDVLPLLKNPNIWTTGEAGRINPSLLPWKKHPSLWRRLETFITKGKVLKYPPPYTVSCLSLIKTSPKVV